MPQGPFLDTLGEPIYGVGVGSTPGLPFSGRELLNSSEPFANGRQYIHDPLDRGYTRIPLQRDQMRNVNYAPFPPPQQFVRADFKGIRHQYVTTIGEDEY